MNKRHGVRRPVNTEGYINKTEAHIYEAFCSWLEIMATFEPEVLKEKYAKELWVKFCDEIKDEFHRSELIGEKILGIVEKVKGSYAQEPKD